VDSRQVTIGIIGLGYVGLPLAVEFGKSRRVVGFDISDARITELRSGKDSTREVSPEAMRASLHLEYSSDASRLAECGIFIVTVPTPIDSANRPDLTPIIKASETVGKAIRRGAIVIYESTVFPGCTEEVCVPILEKHSGLAFNTDFTCGYSPERINPGDKVHTLTTIKKITSGSTVAAADAVDALYREIIQAGT
jgi:UDP-N-acetyl-D-glucosamine/UDP-N-acetyl-D-galactosamine dehydrogenase